MGLELPEEAMNGALNKILMEENAAELHRRAEGSRLARRARKRETPAARPDLDARIRYAGQDDERALMHLAALDSATVPASPILVAEVDGELRAAVSLVDSTAIADPFQRTAHLVQALRDKVAAASLAAPEPVPTTARRRRLALIWRLALDARQNERG
jgi:hypothetical protein